MPEQASPAQIKKELDMRRARIKEDFERRKREFEISVEQCKEKINAHKKKRDADIARFEEDFDRRTAKALKKLLGEKDYGRLWNWLLEKRKKELRELEKEIQPTENEDYDKQLARLQETDPSDLLWIYYVDHQSTFREEVKRDIGIKI